MLRYLPFLLVLALWIYAFIDCLNTPEEEVRHLPKVVWVIIVLLFGEVLIGPVAWLAVGKVRKGARDGSGGAPSERRRGDKQRWVAPDDNPDFLKSLEDETASSGTGGEDESMMKDWEADLRRREEELKRREDGPGDSVPPKS
ncbi:PLD nuclease N-terminal domain-containing protein [Streptomyces sp. Wb2n-11]|uniref:PLD nuclease N-terminal domain-containing protein n=1 Tax=Streptomyces sp. Wb2n-11 TaxID=1030533 RepID=UPI000AD57D18|nr:PLD nuclease N-terminal domain-containing protein [Streptomyces sp. Wb2n-11]